MRPARLSYFFRRRGQDKSRCGSLVAHREYRALLASTNPKPQNLLPSSYCIFDLQMLPTRNWNFDGPCLPRKLFRLVGEFAVELRRYPEEPVQIPHNYFGEVFPRYLPNGTTLQCMSITFSPKFVAFASVAANCALANTN